MRIERDLIVLKSAIKEFARISNTSPSHIDSLLNHPEHILLPESLSTWDNYYLQSSGDIDIYKALRKDFFKNEDYNLEYNGRVINYLLPPVTKNDLVYRFNDEGLDELALQQLTKNKNRLASSYLSDDSILLVGSDAETLKKVLNQNLYRKPANMYRRLLSSKDRANAPKVALFLRPNWLVFQGRIHPDEDISGTVGDLLLDLENYQVILLTIDPRSGRDGLISTIQFLR